MYVVRSFLCRRRLHGAEPPHEPVAAASHVSHRQALLRGPRDGLPDHAALRPAGGHRAAQRALLLQVRAAAGGGERTGRRSGEEAVGSQREADELKARLSPGEQELQQLQQPQELQQLQEAQELQELQDRLVPCRDLSASSCGFLQTQRTSWSSAADGHRAEGSSGQSATVLSFIRGRSAPTLFTNRLGSFST